MCDYGSSTQAKDWIFTPNDLRICRQRANYEARKYLIDNPDFDPYGSNHNSSTPFFTFACGFMSRREIGNEGIMPLGNEIVSANGNPFLDPEEEDLLVAFYAAKISSLVGPLAQNQYLRREVKVTATAAMIFRRFFLSNSVMLYDPKHILVAAAFLATKVEDCMTQVHHLEEGTKLMNAPVVQAEILRAEYVLLGGINCDLLCFHPYKAVLALTEDLRTFLKTSNGSLLVTFRNGEIRPIIGQDLSPIHNAARSLVDDVIVSDIPLLYSPGQIGLAALMVANDQISSADVPKIDFIGYIESRFEDQNYKAVQRRVIELCEMLKDLKEGKYGCGNHKVDLQTLKGVHKKLKKCRGGEKKKKKRKLDDLNEDIDPESKSKQSK
jgi:cyclin H